MPTLLQDVLRTQSQQLPADGLTARLNSIKLTTPSGEESITSPTTDQAVRTPSPTSEEDELIAVQSVAGTPRVVSRDPSRPNSRPQSPTRIGAASRRPPGPLLLAATDKKAASSRDPLKVLPTDLSQRIFGLLTIKQLARCARVNKKWNRSQTLNYVWFQHYRKENFHDESLPPGKWTRRESKQNWRTSYLDDRKKRAKEEGGHLGLTGYYTSSGYSRSGTASYAGSGHQTPREVREEKWQAEAEGARLGKNEMREMYKDLGGRKAKSKTKFQTNTSARDRGGWTAGEEFA